MRGSSIEDLKSRVEILDSPGLVQAASKYAPWIMQTNETPVISLFVYLVNEFSFHLLNIVVPTSAHDCEKSSQGE